MEICKECGSSMFYYGAGEWGCSKCSYKHKEKIICQHCGKREATTIWVAEGGVLAWTHGGGQDWCQVCVIEAQLEHARKMASKIPELEKELEELKGKE